MNKKCRTVSESGFVLVCILWILAALTVITLGFGRRALLDQRAAAYALDELQATWLARGAAVRGLVELEQRRLLEQTVGGIRGTVGAAPSSSNLFIQPDLVSENGHDIRDSFPDMFRDSFGSEKCGYVVKDEEQKICLNRVSAELLEKIEALDEKAKSAVLERLQEAQTCLPPAFSTLEELLCLEGMDSKPWFGSSDAPGLSQIFTVYGDGLVNINTAQAPVLSLLPGMDPKTVEKIMTFRAGPDGKLGTDDDLFVNSLEELAQLANLTPETASQIHTYCKTDSRYFKISGFATRRQNRIRAESTLTCVWGDERIGILRWEEKTGGS